MDFAKEFEKRQDKTTEAERAEQEKKEKGPSVTEILADDEKSKFFLIYLEEQEEGELAHKLLEGNLNAADRAVLEEKRGAFWERLEQAQKIKDSVGGDLENIIKVSPELQQEKKTAGIAALKKVLVDGSISRSFRDPAWMEVMSKKIEDRELGKKAIDLNNQIISEYCKKYNLKEEEFAATLALDDEESPEALKELIKGKMGFFRKIFTSHAELEEMADTIDRREAIKTGLALAENDLHELAGSLHEALQDPRAEQALAAHITGENPPKDPSFKESKAALKSYEIQDKEVSALQEVWDKKKEANKDNKSFDIDEEYGSFIEGAAENSVQNKVGKGKGGFWHAVFKLITGHKLEKKIEK